MVCHPKSFKQFLEVPFFVDVIIVAEHGQVKAFPEAARPDKKQEACRILHALDVSAFVHIIIILFPDSPEVRYAIREKFICTHIDTELIKETYKDTFFYEIKASAACLIST